MTKKAFGTLFAVIAALFLFNSCELLALLNLGKALVDYNYVYIVNGTSESIDLKIEEKEGTRDSEEVELVNKTITLKANGLDKNAIIGGTYKLTIGDKIVTPSDKSVSDDGYYLIYAHTQITISKDSEGNYTYLSETRE